MTKSAKSKRLRLRLEELDSVLVPGTSHGDARPLTIKVNEGDDRVFGFN
ncbi:hypothetical protein [Sphingomonas sp. DT-204]